MLPPDLDPVLPDADRAMSPDEVVRQFERDWTQSEPPPAVTACTLEYMRWYPGVELVATFRLSFAAASVAPHFGLRSVTVTADAVYHRSLAADPGLDGLRAAIDVATMAAWLAESLHRPVSSCVITPVRYRPARRCVLRYDVASADTAFSLYGKVLAGHSAASLAAVVSALDGIAAPAVAIAPGWQLVVQADTGNQSLSSVGKQTLSEHDLARVRDAGAAIARLHARSSPPGAQRSLIDDAEDLTQYVAACERFDAGTAARLRDGIHRARRLGASDGGGPDAPAHGAFRLDQVHTTPSGPVMIDLDSFCWAEPERDLGNLFAYLTWRDIRKPESADASGAMRAALLEGYTSASERVVDRRRLAAYEGVSLLKIAGRRYPRLKAHEWERAPLLIDAAFNRFDAVMAAA